MSDNCIFCKIARGEMPAVSVYENNDVLVFMDIMPVAKGHCLIIPKRHSDSLLDADPDAIAAVAQISVAVANAAKRVVNADGVRVAQFNGAAAGQTVFHYHMHIIPVCEGDNVNMHGRERADSEELTALAAAMAELIKP